MSTAETMVCVVRTTSRMWEYVLCKRGALRGKSRVGENVNEWRLANKWQMSGERGLIGFGCCRCAGAGC